MEAIITTIFEIILAMALISTGLNNRKYKNSIGEKWLNYNLTPNDAKSIIKYIHYSRFINYNGWEYNNKYNEDHFQYLFNLLSLNKNKEKLIKEYRECGFKHSIRLNFDTTILEKVNKQILPKYI